MIKQGRKLTSFRDAFGMNAAIVADRVEWAGGELGTKPWASRKRRCCP